MGGIHEESIIAAMKDHALLKRSDLRRYETACDWLEIDDNPAC